MLFFHGVGNAADLDHVAAFNLFDNRHVLFKRAVGCAFDHQLHGVATADDVCAAAVENFNDIAAVGTLIHFELRGHESLTCFDRLAWGEAAEHAAISAFSPLPRNIVKEVAPDVKSFF